MSCSLVLFKTHALHLFNWTGSKLKTFAALLSTFNFYPTILNAYKSICAWLENLLIGCDLCVYAPIGYHTTIMHACMCGVCAHMRVSVIKCVGAKRRLGDAHTERPSETINQPECIRNERKHHIRARRRTCTHEHTHMYKHRAHTIEHIWDTRRLRAHYATNVPERICVCMVHLHTTHAHTTRTWFIRQWIFNALALCVNYI